MKTKILLLSLAGMVTAGNIMGQITYASGAQTNNCATVAGVGGVNATFIGCGAGNQGGGDYNTFIGDQAGYNHKGGGKGPNDNVAVGHKSLFTQLNNGAGYSTFNVCIGNYSLYTNNPSAASSNGWKNTAVGHNAGYLNATGSSNTFTGFESGYSNTASENTFYGFQSGYTNSSATGNVFTGFKAGYANNASNNTFTGYNAGTANTTGANNTFVGKDAGLSNTHAGENTALGYQALKTQSYGSSAWSSYNVAVGSQALFSNQPAATTNSGTFNVAVGYRAGYSNTTGYHNTFMGYASGKDNTVTKDNTFLGAYAGYNTTGSNANENTFVGAHSGRENTSGTKNVFVGVQAGFKNAAGGRNVFVGTFAGTYTVADSNTFVGSSSAFLKESGNANTYVGMATGYYDLTGASNTLVGAMAGHGINGGNANTAVGRSAASQITSGSNNTFLGYGADVCATCTSYTNVTAIGYQAVVPTGITGNADYVRVGNSSILTAWAQVAWSNGSDRRIKNNIKENVPGLEFIKLLKPVTFHYDIHQQNSLEGYPSLKDSAGNVIGIDTTFWQGKYDIEQTQFTGLVAQQVDSAAQQIGYDFCGVDKGGPVMGLRYSLFTIPLIKAVQELNDTLLKEKQNYDSLEQRVKQLEDIVSQCCAAPQKRMGNTTGDSGTENNAEKTIAVELKSERNIILYQNEPNPFNSATSIRYFIPESSNLSETFIIFYDEFGKEVKKVQLTATGFGKVEAETTNLASGIYSYSIMVGAKVVDTKKMLRMK